jgi:Flp pilus assembly pilin Flp
MSMIRRFLDEEKGLSRLTWALLAAAVAVGAIMYFPQLSFIVSGLRQFGTWLGNGGFL